VGKLVADERLLLGDTAVAATRAPNRGPVVAAASNLPSRSVQQAYDFVLSEGQPQYYQQFIELYPHDPLCDRIRWLLRNLIVAQAWHKTVIANSPFLYKTFADNFSDSQYFKAALSLQDHPKAVPLMQATKLIVSPQLAPQLKQPINFGLPKDGIKIGENSGQVKVGGGLGITPPGKPGDNNGAANNGNTGIAGGKIVTLPVNNGGKTDAPSDKKIVTLPAPNGSAGNTSGNAGNNNAGNGNTGINGGKIVTLPVHKGGRIGSGQDTKVDVKTSMPVNRVTTVPSNNGQVMKLNNNPPLGNGRVNFQGNPQPNKVSFGGNNGGNGGSRTMAMGGGGQMRRGF
jgi:hypothetical protein